MEYSKEVSRAVHDFSEKPSALITTPAAINPSTSIKSSNTSSSDI